MVEFKKGDGGFLRKRREAIQEQDCDFLNVGEVIEQEEKVAGNGPGRPRKKPIIKRNNPKTFKFDDATNRRLQLLKIDYKLDQQDIVFLAVQEYLDQYFPKGKANLVDIERIRKQVAELNGE